MKFLCVSAEFFREDASYDMNGFFFLLSLDLIFSLVLTSDTFNGTPVGLSAAFLQKCLSDYWNVCVDSHIFTHI